MVKRNPLNERQRDRAARKLERARESDVIRFATAVDTMRESALDAIEALRSSGFDPYKASRTYDRFHDPDLIARKVRNPAGCPRGTRVQSLVFDRRKLTKAQARAWARRNGYRSANVGEYLSTWRIRQEDPKRFRADGFRLIRLAPGVQAVIGCPK